MNDPNATAAPAETEPETERKHDPEASAATGRAKAIERYRQRRMEQARQTHQLIEQPQTDARYAWDGRGCLRRLNKPIGNKKQRRALRAELRRQS